MNSLAPCGVRRIALTSALDDLALRDKEKSLLAIFEWEGVPLGQRLFTRDEMPVPAGALACIAIDILGVALTAHGADPLRPDPGRLIEQQKRRAREVGESISVIVCTRGRPQELARCLRSLKRLDPAPEEILVVDNLPSDPRTRELVEGFGTFRYIAEPQPGLSFARNAGVRSAKGELLFFTDDDVEVTKEWCGFLKGEFTDPQIGAVTGLVIPASLDTDAEFTFEFSFGGLNRGYSPRSFDQSILKQSLGEAPPVWEMGAGANMGIRREVFSSVGMFDERLGAGAAGCSEDTELWHRMLLSGWSCRYQPIAAVFHHHRSDRRALASQMRNYMRGHVVALIEQYLQSRKIGNLVRIFVGLPFHYGSSALRLAFAGPSTRRAVLREEVAGLLQGPWWWLKHRRRPKFRSSAGGDL